MLCLAAAHIGYVVLFYVIGRRFGVWAPQDLQYSDTLSTALPWIYPLTIGIYAATSEEFLFRLFAVPWVLRVTKSKALAVVLPALAWGFLHANYPQEPAYIRGVEVGAIGIVAGLVMLRWGILATLVWHYTVDAFLVGLSLMRSADFYSRISGTVVGLAAVIAVAIAGVLYLKSGSFADSSAMLNGGEPLVAPSAPVSEPSAVIAAPAAELHAAERADHRHSGCMRRRRCCARARRSNADHRRFRSLLPRFRPGRDARRRNPAPAGRRSRTVITAPPLSSTASIRW